jgi:hypothetical protein
VQHIPGATLATCANRIDGMTAVNYTYR